MKSPAAFILALLMTVSLGAQNASQLVNLRHWSGQGVAPVYEGFDINPDGSFNMWFGYMNRNRSEEHTSELQSLRHLVCRLLLEKKNKQKKKHKKHKQIDHN